MMKVSPCISSEGPNAFRMIHKVSEHYEIKFISSRNLYRHLYKPKKSSGEIPRRAEIP